jgi:hypothetical protein
LSWHGPSIVLMVLMIGNSEDSSEDVSILIGWSWKGVGCGKVRNARESSPESRNVNVQFWRAIAGLIIHTSFGIDTSNDFLFLLL